MAIGTRFAFLPLALGGLLLSALLIHRSLPDSRRVELSTEHRSVAPPMAIPDDSTPRPAPNGPGGGGEGSRGAACCAPIPVTNATGRLGAQGAQGAQGRDTIRARYPKDWDVHIPPGSRLDSLARVLAREVTVLPSRDLEDQTPLPLWFRVYLRKKNPNLPTTGPYQYPRSAPALLRWMLQHADSVKLSR